MTRLTFGVFFDDQRVMRLAALGKGMSVPPPAREEQLLPPESFTWCTLHRQTRHFFPGVREVDGKSDPARGYFTRGSEQFKRGIFPFKDKLITV